MLSPLSGGNPIGILGAGSIGCYIGAHLAYSGLPTVLVGRQSLGDEIKKSGLVVTKLGNEYLQLRPNQFRYATNASALKECGIVFVTVKSADTKSAAESLRSLKPNAIIVSFQNGLANADVIRKILPGHPVLAGMVPYNVVKTGEARFHNGTSGYLIIEDLGVTSVGVRDLLVKAGLDCRPKKNIRGILWGKLIFNLNNSINALCGIPLREELSNIKFRQILAAAMDEGMFVLKKCKIKPASLGKMIPWLAPAILRLPDALFFRVASNMIKIDAAARSSMWEDLGKHRITEIDYLNGEITSLAKRNSIPAPINSAIVQLIKEAEKKGVGSPGLSAEELAARIGL